MLRERPQRAQENAALSLGDCDGHRLFPSKAIEHERDGTGLVIMFIPVEKRLVGERPFHPVEL
ncbi:hypothetical protein SZMC14600_00710 [Saccharomonospora azurea SZMC 14600]|nr:hypothetical protein SZMC14600_00710 [Saccharomonospora azurea SZMC 14600]